MFADDTNLFFTHKDIRYLFKIVNYGLENINQWFISNELSLNIKKTKTKYSFFHKPSQKENIPLLLPKLIINNDKIQRTESTKYNENKIAKHLGFLYKAKHNLHKEISLSVILFYHTYLL